MAAKIHKRASWPSKLETLGILQGQSWGEHQIKTHGDTVVGSNIKKKKRSVDPKGLKLHRNVHKLHVHVDKS